MTVNCYIFDIDGTVADCTHRVHHAKKKEWDEFFDKVHLDAPIQHMIDVALLLSTVYPIVFVSGRSDVCRDETVAWLYKHHFNEPTLYMRKKNDRRPDYLVKSDLLDLVLAAGYRPLMVFDDRNTVVKMWRERGIPCAQVAEGDF